MPTSGVVAAGRLLIVIITLGMVACAAPGATATRSTGGGTPVAATATATIASTSLPAAAPDGFPVVPGAMPAATSGDPHLLARWLTAANGADVYDFYVAALPDAGFEIQLLAPGGAVAVIRFRSTDGEFFEVALTSTDGGTQIDLREPES